jgi:hypothetical protein
MDYSGNQRDFLARLLLENAQKTPKEQRNVLDTLLVLGVDAWEALELVGEQSLRDVRSYRIQMAQVYRIRVRKLPDDSDKRRYVEMVADDLDPTVDSAWEW